MAVKRDYGSFSKASSRLLAPLVESLGYRPWYEGGFGREKAGWVEGFFLQQAQYGTGEFCVNVGIHVPTLDELWMADPVKRSFGLLIAWRLSDSATEHGGERWYHAKDRQQLQQSIETVAATLAMADSWFKQFQSFTGVVEQYRTRSNLPRTPAGDLPLVNALNYGLLLLLADARQESSRWLMFVSDLLARPMYWDAKTRTFSYDPANGRTRMKPTKDDDLRQRVIDSALARLRS
jgi:hypothetical protein